MSSLSETLNTDLLNANCQRRMTDAQNISPFSEIQKYRQHCKNKASVNTVLN